MEPQALETDPGLRIKDTTERFIVIKQALSSPIFHDKVQGKGIETGK